MLEEELVLEGVASDPKVPEIWISQGVPCPPQQSPFQQKNLGYWTREGLGRSPHPLDFLLLPGPEVMGQHAEV